jgi:hypothetical protein
LDFKAGFFMQDRSDRLGLLFLAVISLVGVFLSLLNWQAKWVELDMLPLVDDALRFLEIGVLPTKGSLLSMGAYNSPMSSWLYIPAVALFDQPGLYLSFSSGVLYVFTLVGMYLLTRRHAGVACALLAVALFAFSKLGMHFAGFIGSWTFFIVWTFYFASRWVFERQGRFLAMALLVWSLGLYNMMVVAPAFFIFPVLWLLYRPPIAFRSLAVAGVIALAVWTPYLAYDAEHGFRNITAQLTRQSLIPADFEKSWCDPSLRLRIKEQIGGIELSDHVQDQVPKAGSKIGTLKSMAVKLAGRLSVVILSLTGNFSLTLGNHSIRIVLELLLAFIVVAMVMVGLRGDLCRLGPRLAFRKTLVPPALLTAAGVALLAASLIANEVVLTRFLSRDGHLWPNEITIIRQFQTLMLILGAGLLLRRPLARAAMAVSGRIAFGDDGGSKEDFLRFLAYGLLVPGFILVILATPSRERYFHWLWPLQCILLAVFTVHVLPLLTPVKWVRRLCTVALAGVICWYSVARIETILLRGNLAGNPPPLRHAIAFLADTLHGEGRSFASIGYNIPFPGYNISYNVLDSRYKVGAVQDFHLRWEYGIENENTCAEGTSPDDEFRVARDGKGGRSMQAHIAPPKEGYDTIAVFGDYRILRKTVK